MTPITGDAHISLPLSPTVAPGVGDWRDPFSGPLGPDSARLAGVIAIPRCLITSLVTPLLLGSSVPAARSAESGVITGSKKDRALPRLEVP